MDAGTLARVDANRRAAEARKRGLAMQQAESPVASAGTAVDGGKRSRPQSSHASPDVPTDGRPAPPPAATSHFSRRGESVRKSLGDLSVDEEPSLSQGSSQTAVVDDRARHVWAADNVSVCTRAAAEAAEKGSAALRGWPFELHFALLAAGYHAGLKWPDEHVRRPLSRKTPTQLLKCTSFRCTRTPPSLMCTAVGRAPRGLRRLRRAAPRVRARVRARVRVRVSLTLTLTLTQAQGGQQEGQGARALQH